MIDVLITVFCVAASALATRYLVMASPLGRIPRKPWNCSTCLCTWGAMVGTALFMDWSSLATHPDARIVLYVGIWLSSAGLARLVVALVRGSERDGGNGETLTLPPPPVRGVPDAVYGGSTPLPAGGDSPGSAPIIDSSNNDNGEATP